MASRRACRAPSGTIFGLRARRDYLRVQRSGRRGRRPTLSLLVLTSEQACPRLGLTVSTRVGKAVVRNRVKRRLRAIARARAGLLEPGADYVVIAHTEAARASFQQLEGDLVTLLRRMRGASAPCSPGPSASTSAPPRA